MPGRQDMTFPYWFYAIMSIAVVLLPFGMVAMIRWHLEPLEKKT
jgi:hypothetical protein